MKILSAKQIKQADAYTITHEPIASIDLMERASLAFVKWFVQHYPSDKLTIHVICGTGNNGGDGLAVARLLSEKFYKVKVYPFLFSANMTDDFSANFERLKYRTNVQVSNILDVDQVPVFNKEDIVIDAILGSGLNRPVDGLVAEVIENINAQKVTVVSIDIPSGTFADRHTAGLSIHAERTLSFELPKFAFMFPENEKAVGEWSIAPIGLHPQYLKETSSLFHYIEKNFVVQLYRKRKKFSHKGTFGHALLAVGALGKIGAGILAARACLRAGVGLLTIHAPHSANTILQISVPEAMLRLDASENHISQLTNVEPYDVLGIGCGIGQSPNTSDALYIALRKYRRPMVLDADALNLIAKNSNSFLSIPRNSILTPHVKEFERLFGKTSNDFERNELQAEKSQELGVYIILKGAHTCISTPEGKSFYNSTGNPGMATAGSGDVLTGILTGLLAQRYPSFDAAILGVYLHGLAGDLASEELGQESLTASDIIQYLGKAFLSLKKE